MRQSNGLPTREAMECGNGTNCLLLSTLKKRERAVDGCRVTPYTKDKEKEMFCRRLMISQQNPPR